MKQNSDPYENPLSEWVNLTIKHEFKLSTSQMGLEDTEQQVKQTIKLITS